MKSEMNATVEIGNVRLHILLVFMPHNLVDFDRQHLLQMAEGFQQALFVNVMQQGRELDRTVLASAFAQAEQSARPAFIPARSPARGVLIDVPLG